MFRNRFLLALACALGLSCIAPFANATVTPTPAQKLFMWKVSSGKSTVYLVGSIHMVPKDFFPLPAAMEKAFDDSSTLVLEIDERKADPMALAKAGVYPPEDEIGNHIKDDTKVAFEKYCEPLDKMTNLTLHHMKPWCAANTIGILEVQKRGFDKNLGIDKHFLDEAVEKKKDVQELESIDFQLHAFDDLSEDLQDKLLKSALVDVDHTDADAKDMVSAWKSGDPDLMDKVATRDEKEHPELKPVMDKLLYERNDGMVAKIEDYLKSGKQTFVVVGSAHLTGPRGLVAQLQKKDYRVEQISE
jgi:uncharacterized protein YbaP (TraB family)